MKTKRISCFIVGVIFILSMGGLLSGCDNGTTSSVQYYYYEFFEISITDFNSVPMPTELTFSSIRNYRNQLRSRTSVNFIGSGTDVTQQDIFKLLTESGMTPNEANAEITLLNTVGNNLMFFTHRLNATLYIILYAEKL